VLQEGDQKKKLDLTEDDTKEKEDAFLEMTGYLMIFSGMMSYDSKHHQKLTCHEVYPAEPAVPSFL
jgi:hypothetical protein